MRRSLEALSKILTVRVDRTESRVESTVCDLTTGSHVVTSPMKGTMPRSLDQLIDERNKQYLLDNEKCQSENLMIVDLLRNDLNRVAKEGSVQVKDLFKVESYQTVHQMVSTIVAEVHPQTPFGSMLEALYPCGSITGAPKLKTMKIIQNLLQKNQ